MVKENKKNNDIGEFWTTVTIPNNKSNFKNKTVKHAKMFDEI